MGMDNSNLKQVIDETGRKKGWVAEKMGVSNSLVSLWISGNRRVLQKYRKRLAEVLGVPYSFLWEKF